MPSLSSQFYIPGALRSAGNKFSPSSMPFNQATLPSQDAIPLIANRFNIAIVVTCGPTSLSEASESLHLWRLTESNCNDFIFSFAMPKSEANNALIVCNPPYSSKISAALSHVHDSLPTRFQ